MFDRSWNGNGAPFIVIIVGLVIIAIFSWVVPYSKGYQAADKDHQTDYKSYKTSKQSEKDCLQLPTGEKILSCYKNAENIARDNHRAEQDLDAQREMANWAEGILWATLAIGSITVIVTIVGVWFVKRTLDASLKAVESAENTNKITKEAFSADLRPYIAIELFPAGPIHFSETDITLDIRMVITNTGRTPAFSVFNVPKLTIWKPETLHTHRMDAFNYWIAQNNIRIKKPQDFGEQSGSVVFPNKPVTYTVPVKFTCDKIENIISNGEQFNLVLVISSTYLKSDRIGYHQTGVVYHISSSPFPSNITVQPFTFSNGMTIPVNQFHFSIAVSTGYVT